MESKKDSVKQNIAPDLSAGSGEIYKSLRPSPPSPLELWKEEFWFWRKQVGTSGFNICASLIAVTSRLLH